MKWKRNIDIKLEGGFIRGCIAIVALRKDGKRNIETTAHDL